MDISCAFATSLSTPQHIALAEQLGYRRAWCYDSPALYPDVWMTLALAAGRTRQIGIGPAVLVPSLRHVMTNAAAAATLSSLAPGRVSLAIGTGFTGRLALGQRPLSWSKVRAYTLALRALLRGEQVEWDEAPVAMLHAEGFAPPRPIELPVLLGVVGERGRAVAAEIADGVIGPVDPAGFRWAARTYHGTVLDPGEHRESARALEAAGHAAGLALHMAHQRGTVGTIPGGAEWAKEVESIPARERHLAIHENHLIGLNAIDRKVVNGKTLEHLKLVLTPDEHRARLRQLEQLGVTEVIYQPAGPDIPRELRAFAQVAGLDSGPSSGGMETG
jgi:5,10-methylenetetrahydromethanopterin reductase